MKLIRTPVLWLWILGLAVVLVLLVASTRVLKPRITPASSVRIQLPGLTEASGLAQARRTADVFWSHNDSKGAPLLYGFDRDGQPVGTLRVEKVSNHDWEALACFQREGRSWLAIGDIGDNGRNRKWIQIHVIEEPPASQLSAERETRVSIAWTVRLKFEDGMHDCESLAVDTRLGQFLLVTKLGRTRAVYAAPLNGGTGVVTARRVAVLSHLPKPSAIQRLFPTPTGRYRGEPTDAALSDEGLTFALLTYSEVLLYRRQPGENWETIFSREPEHFAQHGLPQAEAIAFGDNDRGLYVTGEQRQPVLLRYEFR